MSGLRNQQREDKTLQLISLIHMGKERGSEMKIKQQA
jgi:hypothetical protein